MATLKYTTLLGSALRNYPISSGNLIYCTDTKECYYDVNDTLRGKISNFIYYTAETERSAEQNPSDKYIYIVNNTGTIYRYDKTKLVWYSVINSKQISDITGLFTSLVVATANKNGTNYAPRTLARAVYTDDGQTVEDRLALISKVGTSIAYVTATTDAQKVFTIPFPFDNYLDKGNSFLVYAGTVFIDNRRYTVSGDTLTLHASETGLESGRNLTFIFIFNSSVSNTDYFTNIDGAYVIDKTIPSRKLEKVSDSFALDDSTSIATSQALKNFNDTINTKLDSVSGLSILHAKVTNTTNTIALTATGFTLVDRSLVFIFLTNDILTASTLSINGGPNIPIYKNYTDTIKAGDVYANTELGLIYCADDNRYYVTSGIQYELQTYVTAYTTTVDGVNVFSPNIEHNPLIDKVDVYQNGIKLIRNINYIVNTNGDIILSGYTADKGDVITIEVTKVIRSEMGKSNGVSSGLNTNNADNLISTASDQIVTSERAVKDGEGNTITSTYAQKPSIFSVTLSSAGWNNGAYTINDGRITENALILIGAPTTATSTDLTTIGNAKLTCTNQASGSITLTAYGTVPTSDIIIQLAIIK